MNFSFVSFIPLAATKPKSCEELLSMGNRLSGEYTIWINNVTPTSVYCNMDVDGGGWTVVQRRVDNDTNFHRHWNEYKQGFGNLSKNFWLGLDTIHELTKRGAVLRVDLAGVRGNKGFAKYSSCKIYSESTNYKLEISGFSGDAGDAFARQNNMQFTTKDKDNDYCTLPGRYCNCAVYYKSAWWYKDCFDSDLNGVFAHGLTWRFLNGDEYGTVNYSEMKIRGKSVFNTSTENCRLGRIGNYFRLNRLNLV